MAAAATAIATEEVEVEVEVTESAVAQDLHIIGRVATIFNKTHTPLVESTGRASAKIDTVVTEDKIENGTETAVNEDEMMTGGHDETIEVTSLVIAEVGKEDATIEEVVETSSLNRLEAAAVPHRRSANQHQISPMSFLSSIAKDD